MNIFIIIRNIKLLKVLLGLVNTKYVCLPLNTLKKSYLGVLYISIIIDATSIL